MALRADDALIRNRSVMGNHVRALAGARRRRKIFESRFRHARTVFGIHSNPCAYTGICFRLSGSKVTVQIVRSSRGLRRVTAAVPFADNRQSKAVRRRVDGLEGDGVSTCRVTFDEHRSIIREPRTEPPRTGIEDPTNCGRSELHSQHHADARACAWIAVDANFAGLTILADQSSISFGILALARARCKSEAKF